MVFIYFACRYHGSSVCFKFCIWGNDKGILRYQQLKCHLHNMYFSQQRKQNNTVSFIKLFSSFKIPSCSNKLGKLPLKKWNIDEVRRVVISLLGMELHVRKQYDLNWQVLFSHSEQSFLAALWTYRDCWKENFWLFKAKAVLVTDDCKDSRWLSKEICATNLTARKS